MKRIATTVLVGLASLGGAIHTEAAGPRLVVGIVVDQLRTDYVEYLQNYFGNDGFRRMMRDGIYMRNVDYGTDGLDAVSATTMLYTGAYPSRTGVPSAYIYDFTSSTSRPALADIKGSTITNDSFTPDGIRLTTIADEIAVEGNGAAQVYAVAFDPQQAVAMAGHSANSAIWINNTSGNWATTSRYGTLPSYASSRNFRQALSERIDTMQWRPSARLLSSGLLSQQKKSNLFKYTFPRNDRDVYRRFASTPLANTEVTDMAIEIVRSIAQTPNPGTTGILSVAYTAAPYKYAAGNGRTELDDQYLRLDDQIARLLNAVDKYIGTDNALIFLASTGYFDEAIVEDKRFHLPGGEFSASRAKSLLNSYLSARHGNAGYVGAIRNGQIYFDRKVLEEKHLNADEIIRDSRNFIVKMSGIDEAYTLENLLSPVSDEEKALSRSVDSRLSGDILLKFTPGWTVTDDESYPPVSKQVRESAVLTPVFILGNGVTPREIDTRVDARSIAPAITGMLRIRAPSGAGGAKNQDWGISKINKK